MSEIEARALKWALGDDTGTSSKAIAAVMTGGKPKDDWCFPRDDGDFGRCHRLLKLIPEWRPRLSDMGKVSAEWAALVTIWGELENLHAAKNRSAVYERIKAVTRPLEAKRTDVVRMSDTAAIRFTTGGARER